MKYGSFRKYKRELRKLGNYQNPSETAFCDEANKRDIKWHRRGYPDFMVLRDNEIVGFVEVKPNKQSKLRVGQERFKRFCEKYKIPFYQWCPEDDFPNI